ncbi:hypothetical protein [Mycolicibacterium sp. A43C]
MSGSRGACTDCAGDYALRSDGLVRVHGITGRGPCSGSMKPPAALPPTELVDGRDSPPCGCEFDGQSDDPKDVWIGCAVHACDHQWSGWTRLPTGTAEDFRRCALCAHVELQPRRPCVLCGGQDARAFEVPDYGTAYVCDPCMKGLDQ